MTYMQKIDASAMMRDLTDHETTLVSGGFGTGDITVDLPDSAIPTGYTPSDISGVEFILDSATNELTTIFTFAPPTSSGIQNFGVIHFDAEGSSSTGNNQSQTVTRVLPSVDVTSTTTFKINIFGITFERTVTSVQKSGSVTRTTTTQGQTSLPPPQSGGVGGSGSPARKNPYVRPN